MSKIIVEKKELKMIREKIDSLLQAGSRNFTIPSLKPIYESYDLNDKERLVVDYLTKNPGHSKEQVVSGCNEYSRVTILKAINGLLDKGFLLERKDTNKKRTYHLFVNNQDVAISLEKDLEVFGHFYTNLLDFISPYLKKMSKNENNKSEHNSLIEAIIGPYKYLCLMYITSDLLLWNSRPIDDDTLHRKFAAFFRIMKKIQICLNRLFSNVNYNPVATQLLIHRLYGFEERNIFHILKTFEEYRLSDYAEPVVDALWKMSYPILPLIYPSRYKKQFKDGTLKDWRNLFLEESELKYTPKSKMLPFEE
jgi:predicted transcriptional regulator